MQNSLENDIQSVTINNNETNLDNLNLESELMFGKKKITQLEEDLNKLNNDLLLAKAELINQVKRSNEYTIKSNNETRIKSFFEILPIFDSINIALNNEPENIGLNAIYKQILNVLEKNNIQFFNPVNHKFDPKYHNAIKLIKTNLEANHNLIAEVYQLGYHIDSNLLREATVSVYEYDENYVRE